MKEVRRAECKILGVEINPGTVDTLLDTIGAHLSDGTGATIAGHNLHSAYLYHTDAELKDFYSKATVVLADGAPVLWDFKISGNREQSGRIGSTDWIPQLGSVENLRSILVVGAARRSNALCVEHLSRALPDVSVEGVPGIDWNKDLASQALETIAQSTPDLILVGLGMPLQETFAARAVIASPKSVVATVGGAIDQLAGVQRNAPRWLGGLGLEWLWRLVTQPRRLWRRYLIEPWRLLIVRANQILFPG